MKKTGYNLLILALAANLFFITSAWAKAVLPVFKSGIWRGVLQRPDGKQIVFNFTTAKAKGKTVLYVHNAGERLLVDSIRQSGDSLWIQMPFFASRFAAIIKSNGNLEGAYIKNNGVKNTVIPFTASFGNSKRYNTLVVKPSYNVTGTWAVQFEAKDTLLNSAIGEFTQEKSGRITGTFRTPTGDYRYLEGTVNKDSLLLSAFDGGHAVLFAAKIENDSTLSHAMMYSGLTATQAFTAAKNENATLPDSYNITTMRPGETSLHFAFTSTDGKKISIHDAQYKGKVVIVQILGSWCPNCMDETAFLSRFYKENKERGIEIIGLAYERTEDFAESKEALQPFQKRFDVTYPFLITGVTVSDVKRTEKTLPQLNEIKAFPTTIFISKQGDVDEIRTGYDGPATGVHYEEFKKDFNKEVDKLLKQ